MTLIYAEYLPNIKTLNIQIILPSLTNPSTKLSLSPDNTYLTLQHNSETTTLNLPAHPTSQPLPIPSKPVTELNYRLPALCPDTPSPTIPWTAQDLTQTTSILCSSCKATLLPCGAVKTWKNLPSEHWADMMDLWHCHKPLGGAATIAERRLVIEKGVGLVDLMDIVIDQTDCMDVKINATHALCGTCGEVIGMKRVEDGVWLRKPFLSVSLSPARKGDCFPLENWLAEFILQEVEWQGVRKFVVEGSGEALRIWAFAMENLVSSSMWDKPGRVVKVLWCEIEKDGRQEGLLMGEIGLRETPQLRDLLKESAVALPESMRVFQGWRVGLLRRF
ncbi:hypothetical protein K470DRAFT_271363 [Piedraia hortae CBS 480.64]|uniref:Ubiquitin-conjugating enzyme E2-binding protein n=1 Tax=Piedraia hortae CBS 480.64 TaxID=1314780 RepID=A0A6A7BYL9_9PEZI|nr:hypothetical protein K470DRAFT_271363 [Piedraia hortae CBS 480.64]